MGAEAGDKAAAEAVGGVTGGKVGSQKANPDFDKMRASST